MSWPTSQLKTIYTKIGGYCTYCGDKLRRSAYGKCNDKPRPDGAWEVEHWIPRDDCDSDEDCNDPRNLWPACCDCNDEKSTLTGGEYLRWRWENDREIPERWVDQLNELP